MIIDQIVERIQQGKRFMLTSHRKPDGDSIGSEMAMALILDQLGKEVVIRNRDPFPTSYGRLPGVARILTGEIPEEEHFDAVITMECTEKDRPGLAHLERYFVVNIDHHQSNTMFGNLNWVDTKACAVGEMIYELARRMGVRLTADVATHLYVSISTDTGSFHFSNTTARTFEICAELVRHGASPFFIADALYDHNTWGQVLLLGRCLARLEIDWDIRTATIVLFQKDLEDIAVGEGDTEGIINYPRAIDGIDVAVFFKQVGDHGFRIGIRTKTDLNVADLAGEFGGGGHPQAAGCSIDGDYREVRAKLFAALRRRMSVHSTPAVAAERQ